MISTLHIYLLGDFLLLSDEAPVTSVDLPRLQSLLAYLLLHRNAPQARAHLAYLLWPDSTDAQAHTNLRNLVHKLRQALPDVDEFLRLDRQTLAWQASSPQVRWTLDVQDFEEAVSLAERAGDGSEARRALGAAVKLYRGDLLPSCYDEWILPERDRLRQAMLDALGRLIELQERERDYAAAINSAQRLLRSDPLQETTYRHLMRLYALSGDRAAALRVYHTCATTLERELGTEPGLATREAYDQLLKIETRVETSKEPKLTPSLAQLVGRTHEWEQLQAAWRNASAGQPHIFILSGEAGIGKTRLAEELLTWVERQGIATASARCYAAQGELAFAPVAAWLRSEALRPSLASLDEVWLTEVTRLLPDLPVERPGLRRPDALTENWQRRHMYEAFARAILGKRHPVLLLLDDMQWCDQETLEWLHFLLHFERHAPLLLLGTMRTEEMEAEHALVSLLRNLRRDGLVTEMALEALNADETASLTLHLAGEDLDAATIAYLYQETEGNPLFVVETVRAGSFMRGSNGHASSPITPVHTHTQTPPTVQAVIATRLAQLSPPTRELVGLAAVIGRAFTYDVLAQASGGDEDMLVQGLDELWRRRIVREQGGDAYDFSHDKLREGAYAALSALRRRLLHRRVAETLEMGYGGSPDAVAGQIAAHYEHAGLLPKAIAYYQRAGAVAQQVYANQEALSAYQRALALLDALPAGLAPQEWRQETAASLHEQVGYLFALTGNQEQARQSYRKALNELPAQQNVWRARLYCKIGNSWHTPLNLEEALLAYNMAESALGQSPPESEPSPEWWEVWIASQMSPIEYFHIKLIQKRGLDNLLELVEKVRPVVEQYGTTIQRARFFMALTILMVTRDRFVVSDEILAYARMSHELILTTNDLNQIAWGHYQLGYTLEWHGDRDTAEEELRASLLLAERTQDTFLQLRCLNASSTLYRRCGQVEESRQYSLRAMALATEMQRPEAIGAAKANLGWAAWRENNLTEAEAYCLAALEIWLHSFHEFNFQWMALFPLLAVTLAQDRLEKAIQYIFALLDPQQQRLPDALTGALEAAIQAWDADQPETARAHLQQATTLAQETGYL